MKGWSFASKLCGVGLGILFAANVAQAGVEDLLYEKGQITKEEWVKLKAEQEKIKEEGITQQRSAVKNWFEKISIRGYVQGRYNWIMEGRDLRSEYDSSIGDNTGFILRRVRLVFSGDITDWLSFYIQPEFAGSVSGVSDANSFAQLRDAYTDIFLPVPFLGLAEKELRIRAGLSKIPFGFENVQSSQQRAAIDRSDAINSAANGERDLGLFIYYTPTEKRKLFRRLIDAGLKGSGDYGVLGFGVYNGQTLNITERNDNKHIVLHFTYPLELPYGQIIQFGVDAYRGTFKVATSGTGLPAAPSVQNTGNILDERVGVHFVLFPQPFGLQAEWNWGNGPQLNAAQTRIAEGDIQGGYVQAMYKWDYKWMTFIPYFRWQEYHGGKKHRTNTPFNVVREYEVGLEWQFSRALELTVAYAHMKRTDTQTAPYPIREGDLLRTQLQWNF